MPASRGDVAKSVFAVISRIKWLPVTIDPAHLDPTPPRLPPPIDPGCLGLRKAVGDGTRLAATTGAVSLPTALDDGRGLTWGGRSGVIPIDGDRDVLVGAGRDGIPGADGRATSPMD